MRSVKDYIFYALDSFLPSVVNLILIPLYLRSVTLADYGYFTLIFTLTGLFTMLMTAQIPSAIIRYFHAKPEDPTWQKKYVSSVVLSVICLTCIISALLYAAAPIAYHFLGKIPEDIFSALWLPALVMGGVQGLRTTFESVCSAKREPKKIWHGALIFSIGNLIGAGALLAVDRLTIQAIAWTNVISLIIGVAYLATVTRSYLSTKLCSLDDLKPSLNYSAGMLPYIFSKFVFQNVDKFLVLQFLSAKDVGIYTIVMKIAMIYDRVTSVSGRTIMPILLQQKNEEKVAKESARALSASFVFHALIFIPFIVLTPLALHLVSHSQVNQWQLVAIIAFGSLITQVRSFYVYQLMAAEKTKWIAFSAFCMGIIAIVNNVALIPAFGLWGAALSYSLTLGVGIVITFAIEQKIITSVFNSEISLLVRVSSVLVTTLFIMNADFRLAIPTALIATGYLFSIAYRETLLKNVITSLVRTFKGKSL